MPHRRAWLPQLIEALTKLVGALLLLGVGVYYDHQRMPPGWITVAAIGLLIGPELRSAARALTAPRVVEQPRELLPEAEVALRLGPLVREHGQVVMLEVEEAVRRRALPPGRQHVDGL